MSPIQAVPLQAAEKNENLIFVLTNSGGHVAWLGSSGEVFHGTSWADRAVTEFFLNFRNVQQEEKNVTPL